MEKNWRPKEYNFGELKQFNWDKCRKRFQARDWKPKRFMTGLKEVDLVTGGLPYGLSIFLGAPGTGKSLLAKAIAQKHEALYICCESMADELKVDGVLTADYTVYLPNWRRCIDELFGLIIKLKVDLVVIDSVTTFVGCTTKAVPEAEVRSACFDIAQKCERQIPIIAISQIRGSGNYISPAGGQGVAHSASLLMWFYKQTIKNKWEAEKYDCDEGNKIWTVEVDKDKSGLAVQNKEFVISYDKKLVDPSLKLVSR